MPGLLAFDLDGVLYSSEPFLAGAYREAIDRVNAQRPGSFRRVPGTEEIFEHIGWPVPTILARLFPEADPEAIRLMHAATLDVICDAVARGDGRLYTGVPEVLDFLAAAGAVLVVASNGRRRYVETVLRTYDLERRMAPLLSVDSLAPPSKAALLLAYLDRHAVAPRRAVMVGDRASDVEAARVVGCAFVGCDYGHGHRGEIEGYGPIISDFRQLPDVVCGLG